MISSYKALSMRYLKHNKKRTILTMLGIVMSIALMCSIGMLMVSMQQTMYEQALDQNGNYEVSIVNNISNDKLNKIKNLKGIEYITAEKDESTENSIKDKHIKLVNGDNTLFETLRVKVKEGNLPTNSKEVVLEEWILRYFDKKPAVGSELKLMVGGKEDTYKLVGIAKSKPGSENSGVASAYIFNNKVSADAEDTTKYIKLNDYSNKTETIDEIIKIVGKDNIVKNERLLLLTGESSNAQENKALFQIGAVIAGIIIAATVAVIYNSFHISIADRVRQFGQLRAMGTTKKQIISLVLREALIMVLISIPIGIIIGVGMDYGLAFIFNKISPTIEIAITISPIVMLGSAFIGTVSVFISAIMPAISAGRISPLLAISNSALMSKEKIKRSKKSKLSRYLKIDKIMALKNVKRNKKRFYVTATSIAISVTIFISFMTFYKYATQLTEKLPGSEKFNFSLVNSDVYSDDTMPKAPGLIEDVKKINGVKDVYTAYGALDSKAVIDESKISKIVKDQNYSFITDVKYDGQTKKYLPVQLCAFDNNRIKSLKDYVVEGSIDNLKEDEVIVTGKDKIVNKDGSVISKIMDLRVGDEIMVDPQYYKNVERLTPEQHEAGQRPKVEENNKESYKKGDLIKLKVGAVVEDIPFSVGVQGTQKIILNKNELEKIIANNSVAKEQFKAFKIEPELNSKDDIESVGEELVKLIAKYPQVKVLSNAANEEIQRQSNLQVGILILGFVIIISAISAINIINTVSTNIIMRKRELASLKAIGMTSKELRKMMCLEGAMFGIYGGVIGCIFGTGLSYLIATSFGGFGQRQFEIPWLSILIAMVGVILIGYLAALMPMRKVAKSNIIEGIKQE